MRFGFFGSRGLNEFLNLDGDGFHFWFDHSQAEKFFPNIGQPNPHPPLHHLHIDNPDYSPELSIEASSFSPVFARYFLYENLFEWISYEDKILLHVSLCNRIDFRAKAGITLDIEGFENEESDHPLIKLGDHFFTRGIPYGKVTGDEIFAAIGANAFEEFDVKKAFLKSLKRVNLKETPVNIARNSVFFNLMATKELSHTFYVHVNRTWGEMLAKVYDDPDLSEKPQLFGWDTSFASITLLKTGAPNLAKDNLLSLLEGQQSDGRIPQFRMGHRFSNRSNPPIWFLAAEKIFEDTKDKNFLDEIYPKLLANYEWFCENRQNDDFSFSWGSDNEENRNLLVMHGKVGAVYESGLDDSPIFDEMGFENSKLDYACVDLTSLMVRSAMILLGFAKIQKDKETVKKLTRDLVLYESVIHEFFDFENEVCNSFKKEGEEKIFASEITALSFYPLLTPFLKRKEVKLLEGLLKGPEFAGEVLSLSRRSKHFNPDGDYWRGRIWPPMVWLAAEGFRAYNSKHYLKIKTWAEVILMTEWEFDAHIHENYSALSHLGEPEEGVYARSCPFYSWGGLLGIL